MSGRELFWRSVSGTVADGRGLGTNIRLVVTDPGMLAACQTTVMALLRAFDETCSRFRTDSEISALNASAGSEVRVSPLLARALDEALRAAQLTNGDVDPTVGAAMDGIGYDVDFGSIVDDGALPVGAKWRTLSRRKKGKAVVLANGAEGEPLSDKDRLLLETRPHLVLDGAFCAAQSLGADRVVLYINQEYHRAIEAMRVALSERREPDSISVSIVRAPARYVAGEETAAVHCINEKVALPQSKPPRPFERGIDGRPTLIQNVETLAYVGLIARRSDAWFRGLGRNGAAGSMLVTVGGAVKRPGVFEVPQGISVAEALELAGAEQDGISAVLLGGYFGGWVPTSEVAALPLEAAQLRARGRSLGCGVIFAAPADACGVVETASILAYLAGESARQCGPCVFGLRALSDAVTRVATYTGSAEDLMRLTRWAHEILGRGACNHPDGASGFLESALATFGSEFVRHVESHSCGMDLAPLNPSERVRERVRK